MEAGCEDRISSLPVEIIHHLLGFLPAPEAVRTSLLARGWRHHWKSMRSLRLNLYDCRKVDLVNLEWLNRFMGHLFHDLCLALDVCDIFVNVRQRRFDVPALESYRWVRQVVSELRVRVLAGEPLVSAHLARLELRYVMLGGRILDFSRCPALGDLVMSRCDICAENISSQSLKRLRIKNCDFCNFSTISAPNLIWLKLEYLVGACPVLESMPLLEKAIVRLDCDHDPCEQGGDCRECCGLCKRCVDNNYDHGSWCMLLQGLSSAANLELEVPFAKFADTTCYPAFTKLKTLSLGEWCVAADFRALICLLERSPILEKLTIELNNKVLQNIMEGSDYPVEQPASVSENLELVEVLCFWVDERVSKISKLFSVFDIPVNIE